VEAGLTLAEAIHVATENGALYLGQQDRIGTLSTGKQADLIVIKGDPSKNIEEIENLDAVFKSGIGYDSKKLIDSVRGQVCIRQSLRSSLLPNPETIRVSRRPIFTYPIR
jgi:adenine deaminase